MICCLLFLVDAQLSLMKKVLSLITEGLKLSEG